jgi:SAM-dependent methyltransferase
MTNQANRDNTCASSSNPIQVAKQEGWRTAAHILAGQSEDPASELEYITSERCADFRFLLPVTGDDSVLDICGGWGSTTAAFARISKHVFSLHSSSEKLAFTGVRCDQEELNNVTLIQSSPVNIPLPAQSCQVVLLTEPLACGLLPNAGAGSCDHQLQILKSIYRVLTPGGSLYLNIDNRFSYRYLLGARVPPTNLRFISLLPRSLANYYSRRILGIDYPAVAQSLGEITALLKQAGFINPDPLYPIPGYKKFRFLTNFDSRVITGYMISRLQLHSGFNRTSLIFARFAAALGILRWSSPGISVIAYKDGS